MAATDESGLAFAQWLYENHPSLFARLSQQADIDSARLNGITDFLSSVGSTLSDAVQKVGSYVTSTQGMQAITQFGTAYLQGKTQQNVLKTQMNMMQAGMMPAPISTYSDASGTRSIYDPTGQPVSSRLLSQIQPSFISQYGVPLAIGAGALLLILALKR